MNEGTLSLARRSALSGLLLAALTGPANTQCEVDIIRPNGLTPEDFFAKDVEAVGDTMLISDRQDGELATQAGSLYVYRREENGWVQVDKLFASDGQAQDFFGYDIDFDGERSIVGAFGVTNGGFDSAGAAYILVRDGVNWIEEAKVLDANPVESDLFGQTVAIDGDTAAVKSGGDNPGPNEVHIYERDGSGWTEVQTLVQSGQSFGQDLFLLGDSLYVGAPKAPTSVGFTGAVFVYRRTPSGWIQALEIAPTQGSPSNFGASIDGDGQRLVIGDSFDSGSGAAHVYRLLESGWTLEGYLQPDIPDSRLFGADVALEDDRVLVGAPWDEELASFDGAAFEFEYIEGEWVQTAKVYPHEYNSLRDFARRVDLLDEQGLITSKFEFNGFAQGAGALRVYELGNAGSAFCFCATDGSCNDPDPLRGCENARGHGALLHACGSASVSADDLRFSTLIIPSSQTSLVYMGPNAVEVPFGNGFRCVGDAPPGNFRFPTRAANPWGVIIEGPGIVEFSRQNFSPGGQIESGDTWSFQTWYRDSAGPCGSTFNFSNAVSVSFTP